LDAGSWITNPKTSTTKEEGKICCLTVLFGLHKFHEIENYFIFKQGTEKNWSQFTKNYFIVPVPFTPKKLSLSSEKYGMGIRKKIYPGFWIQGTKKHRIPDPQHWYIRSFDLAICFVYRTVL
jgi:hypothetical protein